MYTISAPKMISNSRSSWYLRQIADALIDHGSEKIADFVVPGVLPPIEK
jgi:hypothetical protein